MAEPPHPTQRLIRAANIIREAARGADTGERWECMKHYDDLYLVDFMPSVDDAPDMENPRCLPDDPDGSGLPLPADIICYYHQARHISRWDPLVAPAVASFLESEAEHHKNDPSFERDTEPLCDSWPHAQAITTALLRED